MPFNKDHILIKILSATLHKSCQKNFQVCILISEDFRGCQKAVKFFYVSRREYSKCMFGCDCIPRWCKITTKVKWKIMPAFIS